MQYFDYGKSSTNSVYWYIMELLVGDPVDIALQKEGPFCEADAIKVNEYKFENVFTQNFGQHNVSFTSCSWEWTCASLLKICTPLELYTGMYSLFHAHSSFLKIEIIILETLNQQILFG